MEEYLGYIKYRGEGVQDGMMDARKSAEALLGFDGALRHFISRLAPSLKDVDFEIPVRIRKGSWEALIPQGIDGWIQAGIGVAATAYLTKAAQKAAERDFDNLGFRDVFIKSLEAIKWVAKIGKHLGTLAIREFDNVQFSHDNSLIGLPNEDGEVLFVPKQYLDLYVSSSPTILQQITSVIDEDRTLIIGTIDDSGVDETDIGNQHKVIFCPDDASDDEDVLFPELVHGDEVVLDGEVTRENKTSNSMGFKYLDHILTAYPETGSIVRYKPLLFLRCRLYGTVSRLDEKDRTDARRPKLFFSHIEPLENEEDNWDLFS
ncbi:MAG: hypothetical protein JXR18_15140 [Neptuniibacter sp.]